MQSFVDNIYCISLRERDDRYEECRKELARVGWLAHTTFFRPEKHPTNGHQGCYESHQAVIRAAQAKQEKYILILEDDVVIDGKPDVHQIADFRATGADIYFLGSFPVIMWPDGSGIWRCRGLLSHAYILNTAGPMAQKIVNYSFANEMHTIDFLYAMEAVAYTSCPMICFQRLEGSSDTNCLALNRFFLQHSRYFCRAAELAWRVFWWYVFIRVASRLLKKIK